MSLASSLALIKYLMLPTLWRMSWLAKLTWTNQYVHTMDSHFSDLSAVTYCWLVHYVKSILSNCSFKLCKEIGLFLEQTLSTFYCLINLILVFFLQYIGSDETDRRADEVSKLGIMDLWTPESHYRWSASRYGGHVSAIVEPVHPSRLFMCSMFHHSFFSVSYAMHKFMRSHCFFFFCECCYCCRCWY